MAVRGTKLVGLVLRRVIKQNFKQCERNGAEEMMRGRDGKVIKVMKGVKQN